MMRGNFSHITESRGLKTLTSESQVDKSSPNQAEYAQTAQTARYRHITREDLT